MDGAKLEAMKDSLVERQTKALLVIRNDRIVCEWYQEDHGPEKRHYTASMAKALVGGVSLAVAVTDGRIQLNDKAAKYIPQWKDDPVKSKITVRHLGSHTSGVEDAEADNLPHGELRGWKGDFWKRLNVPNDPFSVSRDRAPVLFEPGTAFQYSNPGIAMLSYAITAALRDAPEKDLRTLLRDRIMRPIGAPNGEWSVGYGQVFTVDGLPLVASWGGGGYTARALARVGRLMLRKGNWEGAQLISEEAVRVTTTSAGLPGENGMGWWTNADGRFAPLPNDAFWASGAGHQTLLVVPSLNLICVRNGGPLSPKKEEYRQARGPYLFDPLMAAVQTKAHRQLDAAAKGNLTERNASTANSSDQPDELDVLGGHGHTLVYDHLMRIVQRQSDTRQHYMQASLASPQTLASRQERLRDDYLRLLGPLPKKTPLNAQVTGWTNCNGYRIENVVFESRPDHHVTGNLYIPTDGKPPFPAVLVACGHSANGKAYEMYQAVSALLARNGMVALCFDPICQGERIQLPHAPRHGTTTHTLLNVGARLVGRSVAWYEAWDAIRSIDYLLSRSEVDRGKPVGMTGTSGGGTQTTFLMALETRIGPAAPSCYIQTRQRKFERESFVGTDGCQQLPFEGAAGIDHVDYITMRAPKPTIILGARRDHHDIRATCVAATEAAGIFAALGRSDRFRFFESDTPHGFYQPHREMAVRWMKRWLLDIDQPIVEPQIELQADQILWASAKGQVLESFPNERTVADLNLERACELADSRRRFWTEHDRAKCLGEVRRLIGLPERLPKAARRSVNKITRDGYTIEKLVITRDSEVPIPALLFVPRETDGVLPATLYVDGRGKATDAALGGRIEQLVRSGRIVLSIDARGWGETSDDQNRVPTKFYNTEHRLVTVALHVGRPLLGQRVDDVLAAFDLLARDERVDAAAIELVGIRAAAPVVLHAGVLDSRVSGVKLRGGIRSWVDDVVAKPLQRDLEGCVIPSALLTYDLPDLAAALNDTLELDERTSKLIRK
jgi:CubicO group peptidase (beta-lactamase class C family)/cephalosporin-C deacetylase-like acetyl esterase